MDAKPDAAAARRHGQIIWRDPRDLAGYEKNSRTHSDAQVRQIRASIDEFGFANPILLKSDEKTIGAGHARQLAALLDPPLDEVPTITLSGLSDAQWRAYVIADNRLALNAGWDEEMLAGEIKLLDDDGFDLSLLGFDMSELSMLLNPIGEGLTDPDAVPEPPAKAVTNLGDVWILGKHRIICGDCTDADVVAKLLAGAKPQLMVTDPPYGVEYDPAWRGAAGMTVNEAKLGKVLNDDRADWREAWALFDGDVAYIWHASSFTKLVTESLEACKFAHRSTIIWAKDRFTLGRADYHWQHETALYVVREGKPGHYRGGRKQSTVWNIPAREDSGFGHSTQKPVECMKRPIENNSLPGEAVYEPFSGSGTTIIAGEMTGRHVYASELNPPYVDMAVMRWQQFSGQVATLEETGKSFDSRRAARNAEIATTIDVGL